jgi:8-oxo-dGTP diphosphatase
VTSMQRTQHGDPIDERIDFFFTCRSWTGEPHIVEPEKAAALQWFPLTALPDPVVPHERVVLDGLGTGLPSYTTYGF